MRRLSFLLAAALAIPVATARAQILLVYGTFSDNHISGLINGTAGNVVSGYSSTTTSRWNAGFGAGATFGVLPVGPIRLGFDLRVSTKPGNDGADLIFAGPRLGLKLPLIRLKPYIQASGGYLRTRTTLVNSGLPTGTQSTASFGAYEVLGGVDYPLMPLLDLRLIELGGGKGYNLSAAGISGNYTISLFTINTGIVFHF